MYNECRHIFTGGRKCQSPALREQNFCYFHANTRKCPTPKNQPYDPYIEPKETALELPPWKTPTPFNWPCPRSSSPWPRTESTHAEPAS